MAYTIMLTATHLYHNKAQENKNVKVKYYSINSGWRKAALLHKTDQTLKNWFADYIANGLISEPFGLPEMCWRAPVHLDT